MSIYKQVIFLRRRLRWMQHRFGNWVDAFWGYDVFIAYRRADGATYAQSLYQKLSAEKVSCFIDRAVYGPGLSLRIATRRNVAKSSLFCLIGSPELLIARAPVDWVEQEVATYLATHRDDQKVLLIDFGGRVATALDAELDSSSSARRILNQIKPFLRQTEDSSGLAGAPSDDVLAIIRSNLSGRRRDRNRLLFFQASAAILLSLLAITTALGGFAWSQKQLAERETVQAEASRRRAIKDERLAKANERLAKKNEQLAKSNERRAKDSERVARLSKDEARRNLEIAKGGADDLASRVASNIPRLKDKQEEAVLVILESARALIEKLAEIDPANLELKKSYFLIWSQSIEHYLARRQFAMARKAGESCLAMIDQLQTLEKPDADACREKAADARLATDDAAGAAAVYTELRRSYLQNFSSAQDDFDDFVQQAADMGLHVFSQGRRLRSEAGPAARAVYEIDVKLGDAARASRQPNEALQLYDSVLSQSESDFANMEALEADDLTMRANLGSALAHLQSRDRTAARASLNECVNVAGTTKWADGAMPIEAARILGQAYEELADLDLADNNRTAARQDYDRSLLKRKQAAGRDISHLADQVALGKVLIKAGDSSAPQAAFGDYFESVKAFEIAAANPTDQEAASELKLAITKLIKASRGEASESDAMRYVSDKLRALIESEPQESVWQLGYAISQYFEALPNQDASQRSSDLARARELINQLDKRGQIPQDSGVWLQKIRNSR